MGDSEDEDVLFDNDHGRTLIGGKQVKNVDDVLNSGQKDRRKLRKTLALCFAFLSLGLCLAILGPTLHRLQQHLKTTLPKVSLVFTGRSLGYLMGAALGGPLFDWLNPMLLLAGSLLLCGIGILVPPFFQSVAAVAIALSTVGIAMGFLDTGANVVCIRMWGKKRSGTMLQALHFSFAVGAFIAPLIAAPFLASTSTVAVNTTLHPSTLTSPTPAVTSLPPGANANEEDVGSVPLAVSDGIKSSPAPIIDGAKNVDNSAETEDSTGKKTGTKADDGVKNTDGSAGSEETANEKISPINNEAKNVDKSAESEGSTDKKNGAKADDGVKNTDGSAGSEETANEKNGSNTNEAKNVDNSAETEGSTGKKTGTKADDGVKNTDGSAGLEETANEKNGPITNKAKNVDNSAETEGSTDKKDGTKADGGVNNSDGSAGSKNMTISANPDGTNAGVESKKETVKKARRANSDPGHTGVNGDDPKPTQSETTKGSGDDSKTTLSVPTALPFKMDQLQKVYVIIGALVLPSSLMFFYFFFTQPKGEPRHTSQDPTQSASSQNKCTFRNRILVLLFIFYFLYVGGEVTYGGFVSTFAVNSAHHLDEGTASHVTAFFWGMFALGRGLAICLASVFSPLQMVVADLVGCIATAIGLCIAAESHEAVLWIGSGLLGLFMASLFPSGIAWLQTYTTVTGTAASILVIGSSLGEMCVPLIVGFFFNDAYLGPIVLMYIMLLISGCSTLIFFYVIWLAAETGQEKDSLPAEKNPALDILDSVEQALPLEDLSFNGSATPKQLSRQLIPPNFKKKNHKE